MDGHSAKFFHSKETQSNTEVLLVVNMHSLGFFITDQSSQSPDNQTNTIVRLEKATEAGPKSK